VEVIRFHSLARDDTAAGGDAAMARRAPIEIRAVGLI
jgi:hypothetical protein